MIPTVATATTRMQIVMIVTTTAVLTGPQDLLRLRTRIPRGVVASMTILAATASALAMTKGIHMVEAPPPLTPSMLTVRMISMPIATHLSVLLSTLVDPPTMLLYLTALMAAIILTWIGMEVIPMVLGSIAAGILVILLNIAELIAEIMTATPAAVMPAVVIPAVAIQTTGGMISDVVHTTVATMEVMAAVTAVRTVAVM